MERCRVCGRGPAQTLKFRRHIGMIFLMRMVHVRTPLCRDHALQIGREYLNKTLVQGWWGVVSFFANFYAIGVDLSSLGKAKKLGAPVEQPSTGTTAIGLAPPGTPGVSPPQWSTPPASSSLPWAQLPAAAPPVAPEAEPPAAPPSSG